MSQPAWHREPVSAPSKWQTAAALTTRAIRTLGQTPVTRIGSILVLFFILFAVIGPLLTASPLAQTAPPLDPPSANHWFGTDHLGRDLLARTAAGARVSLLVATVAIGLGLLVALPIGMTAGYFGATWIDDLLMRAVDVILALPLFILAIVFLGFTGTSAMHVGPFVISAKSKVILPIALATVPMLSRVARAATLVERQEDYIDALILIGVRRVNIVFSEILINVLPPVIVQAFLWMAIAIFAEAALSFLGLGIPPPDPTMGNLLYDARGYIFLGAWWYSFFPGLLLLLVIVGFNLVGDGLSDLLDIYRK